MINRAAFFDCVRKDPFPGRLIASQVDGMTLVLNEWERRHPNGDLRHLAYMLATDYWETAKTMRPIAEYGRGKGKKYGAPDKRTGQTYYGRGLVQLTWYDNYALAGRKIGVDLLNNPDLAMSPGNAVRIMFEGMSTGWFTGKKLSDYFNGTKEDWRQARKIINGLDKAEQIADIARAFHTALVVATGADPSYRPPPIPPDVPALPRPSVSLWERFLRSLKGR
jgi:putative chitinase